MQKQKTIGTTVRPIDRTLSGATTTSQSGPKSDGSEGVLRIPQSSSNTGTWPSDYLVSYQDTRCGILSAVSRIFSAEKQSVYSTAPTDRANVSCNLLRILRHYSNAFILLIISTSTGHFSKPLETIPSTLSTIGSIASRMFNSFL